MKPLNKYAVPGLMLTDDPSFMKGHGSFCQNGSIYSSVKGYVENLGCLIMVKSVNLRYQGYVGDVVVGRISELGPKKWKVDINSIQDASLHLSSINLPGNIQRRKSELDELKMREFYSEGDVICAEVQTNFQDGSIGLHTRSHKYGKLVNGVLIKVSQKLIKRARNHFTYPLEGIEVIIGVNGFIWIGASRVKSQPKHLDHEIQYSSSLNEISPKACKFIWKTIRVIDALNNAEAEINDKSINEGLGSYMLKS